MALASASGEQKDDSNVFDFPQFDILSGDSSHSDHYYHKSTELKGKQDSFKNPNSKVSKTIVKEWKILEQNLPESIYVRAYEDRIDLLRAVIIGAAGTPYHDGLFFFDIVLPLNYPKQPPKVYYHAHGMRLNPNLYDSGYVCLSLIHTWSGSGVELWLPNKSTILQLLVSLQGLVLNDKPYFNEPGYEVGLMQMNESWMMNSLAYNENAFILSCKTLMHKVRMPPKGFERFVGEHFCKNRGIILAAVRAYQNGEAIVGQYNAIGSSSDASSRVNLSNKFKLDLEKIYVDLSSAFLEINTSPLEMDNSATIQNKKTDEYGDASLGTENSATSKGENEEGLPKTQTSPKEMEDSTELQSKKEEHGNAPAASKYQGRIGKFIEGSKWCSKKGFSGKIKKALNCVFQ